MIDYPFTIHRLSTEEGGGYLAESLDLSGCMADGETVEDAIHNLEDAMISWIRTAQELGYTIPEPSNNSKFSGKWVIRTPRTLHRKLVEHSKKEGVSLNTLVVSLLSEGLGSKNHPYL